MSIAQDRLVLLLEQVKPVLERFVDQSSASQGDFAKVEQAARTAVLTLRRSLMSAGLQASLASGPGVTGGYRCPACRSRLSACGQRPRHIVTTEGEALVRSARYRCLHCQQDHYPLEAANGLRDGHYTTGAKGLIATTACQMPYEPAARVLAERGVSVSAKEVDRKVAEVSAWREAEERAAVGRLGAAVRAGRLPPRRPRRRGPGQPGEAQRQGIAGASVSRARVLPSPLPSLLPSPLHTWSGWQEEMVAMISVDGGKVRSPVVGAEGLEWFEARLGVIAPVLPEPAPSPDALAAIDAAGAWPPVNPTSQQPGTASGPGTKRPAPYPRRPQHKRRHRGARPGAASSSSAPKVAAVRARARAPGEAGKAATLYLAGPTSLAGPEEINALFRLLVAARLGDPHPGRLLLFVADGADWIWWRVALFFPTARQVLDIYHAAEHVASAARACWGEGSPQAQYWSERARAMLLARGGPERIRKALQHQLQHGQPANPEVLRTELAYLDEHKERMPYADLHAQGLPVGSGAMESAVKQMSTQRLRQPGIMWTREGAERMLRLRAAHLSGNLQHTVLCQHARLLATTDAYALHA